MSQNSWDMNSNSRSLLPSLVIYDKRQTPLFKKRKKKKKEREEGGRKGGNEKKNLYK